MVLTGHDRLESGCTAFFVVLIFVCFASFVVMVIRTPRAG
jgi:hypothetical protein